MYQAEYSLKSSKKQKENKEQRLRLVAKFDFRSEVASVDRKETSSRISTFPQFSKGGDITEYLKEVEGLEYASRGLSKYSWVFEDSKRRVIVKDNYWNTFFQKQLCFKIIAKTNHVMPLEKLLNLDKLSDFLLTGEID